MRLNFTLIGVLAVAILAIGCGSSGGSGSTSAGTAGSETGSSTSANSDTTGTSSDTTGANESSGSAPLSKKQFVKKAEAICANVPKSYTAKVAELEKGKSKPSTAETNLKAAVPPLYTAIEELEELPPPSGDEQKVEAIIASLEAAAKGLEKKPESELSGPKSPYAEFQKLTKEYGLEFCSSL